MWWAILGSNQCPAQWCPDLPDHLRTGMISWGCLGYEKRRRNGRWTALYELRPNVYRSAGTFDTPAEAETTWREQERSLRIGNFIDPAKARLSFARYAHPTGIR
jgi:hypothetical protein